MSSDEQKEAKEEKKDKKKEKGGEEEEDKKIKALDEGDIKLMMRYGKGVYDLRIKDLEKNLAELNKKIGGIKETDTGLSLPSQWFLEQDQQLMKEKPLIVARCNKILNPGTPDASYLIHIR